MMDSSIENQIELERQKEFFKDMFGEPEDLDTALKEAHRVPVPDRPLRKAKRKRRRRR